MTKKKDDYDIFIKKSIYPEASSIFTFHPKPVEDIKEDCIIVIDTNALLVPYKIGKASLEQIQKIYSDLIQKSRLIIPGQVAREFAENRARRITELYQNLSRKKHIKPLQKGSYPLLESIPEYQEIKRLEKEIDKQLNDYKEVINKVLDHIRGWTWNDPVSVIYGELFSENVILDVNDDLSKLKEEFHRRQLHEIPPGYKDSSKDDLGVGDVLIWFTILKIGEQFNKSVLFVSGDEKADWWYQSEGRPLYPRYELVDEFRRYSGEQSFHIIKFSDFLDLFGAEQKLVREVRQKERQYFSEISPDLAIFSSAAFEAVFEWLRNHYPNKEILIGEAVSLADRNVPDFIIMDKDGSQIGVEIKILHSRSFSPHRLNFIINQVYHDFAEIFDELKVILIFERELTPSRAQAILSNVLQHRGEFPSFEILFGTITVDGEFNITTRFYPDGTISWDEI